MQSLNGIIVLDKPPGISSARAVDRVKRLLPRGTKIGHAGTLDPFATGVLVLLAGKATKMCESLMDQAKEYEATVKLGATTETDDPESPERAWTDRSGVTREAVSAALQRFVGAIEQRPPVYSAMKIGGRRAYDLARKGKPVELEARTVQVYSIEMDEFDWPKVRLRIRCGRGTYIRSIARDLGEALGVGGYLMELRRTRVGEFGINRAATLEMLDRDGIEEHLIALPK